MNVNQFSQLLTLLNQLVSNKYTITGAADWPILVIVGGSLIGVLIALIGMMWSDLRTTMKDHKGDWQVALTKHEIADSKELEKLWSAMQHYQEECYPPRERGHQ